MSKIQYIGRKTDLCGKTVFEILSNLKNFGIGRMLGRSVWDKFPEPSYYIVKDVAPQMDDELKFGRIWVEKVFRGQRYAGIAEIKGVYHPDYRLIPKDEEEAHLKGYKIIEYGSKVTLLPRYYTVPPLMKEFLIRCKKEKGEHVNENEEFKIPFVYNRIQYDCGRRIAEDGEEPDIKYTGKPNIPPKFLEGINKEEINQI